MANRVQHATHARSVNCYDHGEIIMGDGTYHAFYDCLSSPPTSTNRPTTRSLLPGARLDLESAKPWVTSQEMASLSRADRGAVWPIGEYVALPLGAA
jgi:hypothetical protein